MFGAILEAATFFRKSVVVTPAAPVERSVAWAR
jgi:hypothetical protein